MKRHYLLLLLLVALLVRVMPAGAQGTGTPTAEDKALAAHALDMAHKAQGTMGQESANFLLNDWPRKLVSILAGETPVDENNLNYARGVVKGLADCLDKAPNWPKPPALIVPYTRRAPIIDGKLDDPAWKKALVLKGAYALNTAQRADNTTWRLLWDDRYLYLGVTCADKEVIAPNLGHNGEIYNYDCVEFFLLPNFKQARYWELEVSATGDLFESMNTKQFDHWGGNFDKSAHMQGLRYAATVQGTANQPGDKNTTGFTVEMAVPFDQLPGALPGAKGKAGLQLRTMIARMDRNSQSFTAYAFCPLLSWTHNIWNYSTLTLKK